jgi:electron transfer flavoprotein alpha subunit
MVIVVAECASGHLSQTSREAVAAARHLASDISLIVPAPAGADAIAEALQLPVAEVVALEHDAFAHPTAEVLATALAPLLAASDATHVLWAHTYQARDYVPRLSARLGRPLATDCVAIERTGDGVLFTRTIFHGRLVADVVLDGPGPHFVTTQIGAFRDTAPAAPAPAAPQLRHVAAEIPEAALQVRAEPPVRDVRQSTDLTQARRIVAVGRGIREESHLGLVRELAAALGAEIAASRPVCDAGWLPMDRQIGSSGQTVAPELYVAVGISGAIQHIVGMKGSKTIVAINRDPDAPIFEIADYGIVGDLFEVVPALTATLASR